jgi:hypothetical protein
MSRATCNVAIETWTLSWSAIGDEFRARLSGLRGSSLHAMAPWWEQARLLRVMGCSHGYAWNVQQTYNQRRGKNLLLSPLDWLLVEHYAFYDIPLRGIKRGIHFMFDRRDRAPEIQHINSLAYCDQAILKETELMREAAVGCHGAMWEEDYPRRAYTLLLAVPPAGRMTFAAMQSERQVDRVAEIFQVGIVFTVYPEAWHKSEAQARYGANLEFLDEAPCNGLDPEPSNPLLPGSRLAGCSRAARSRQPFLKQEARSGSELQESPALDVPQSDDRGSRAPAIHGKTQPLSNRPLHPPICAAELHPSEVHAELGGQ